MKFRLFTLLILLVFSLDVASAQDAKKAEYNGVEFDKTAVDFGDVLEPLQVLVAALALAARALV